jgi:hypothetical protein
VHPAEKAMKDGMRNRQNTIDDAVQAGIGKLVLTCAGLVAKWLKSCYSSRKPGMTDSFEDEALSLLEGGDGSGD